MALMLCRTQKRNLSVGTKNQGEFCNSERVLEQVPPCTRHFRVTTRTLGAVEVAVVLVHMNALTERRRKLKQSMHIWGWGGDETCYINSRLFL